MQWSVNHLQPLLAVDFADGSTGEESACNVGDTGDTVSIPGLGRSPGGGNDKPLHYSCLENSMDKVDQQTIYSSRGRKESDMIEHAHNEE